MTMLAKATTNQPPTQTANWQDLCARLRAGADVDVLLAVYAALTPESRELARLFAWAYRYQYGLKFIDVLGGHGVLFKAWRYEDADFDACVTLASIDARLREQRVTP